MKVHERHKDFAMEVLRRLEGRPEQVDGNTKDRAIRIADRVCAPLGVREPGWFEDVEVDLKMQENKEREKDGA